MNKRIGVLTGGGDAPGLNAAIRAVVHTSIGVYQNEVFGIRHGYGGLLEDEGVFPLDYKAVQGILPKGGTILGAASGGNPFAIEFEEGGKTITRDASKDVINRIGELGLDMIVAIGGDGTMAIAQELIDRGAPMVGIPKTIDNDVMGTEMTIGFDTAVGIASDALDRLHTTAASHHRAMVLELMGRYAGFITLVAGISGGADVILIPEIPFRYEAVCKKIQARIEQGTHFSLLAVSEGAHPVDEGRVYQEVDRVGGASPRLGGIGAQMVDYLESECGVQSRVTVLGHLQRGGTPSPYDRWLASQFGTVAARLADEGKEGRMAALQHGQVVDVDMKEAFAGARQVDVDGIGVQTARGLGISMGDRYDPVFEMEELV